MKSFLLGLFMSAIPTTPCVDRRSLVAPGLVAAWTDISRPSVFYGLKTKGSSLGNSWAHGGCLRKEIPHHPDWRESYARVYRWPQL